MKLHELSPQAGSRKKRKIVGRGLGSGHGTYSTRGMKGQKARSGSKRRPGFEGGRTSLIRQIPKKRGFKSLHEKPEICNIEDLQKTFSDGEKITKENLVKSKLIKSTHATLKILGEGELTKKFTIEADEFSKSAEEKIKKAGGKIIKLK
jgi:large subunit ribosomal protein L15